MPLIATRPGGGQATQAHLKRARSSERSEDWANTPSSRHSRPSGDGITRRKRRVDISEDEDAPHKEPPDAGSSNIKLPRGARRKVKFAREVLTREASQAPTDDEEEGSGSDDGDDHSEDDGQGEKKEKTSILVLHTAFGGQVAAAFYEPEEGKISLMEDAKDSSSWDLAVLVMEQCSPDIILTSTTAKDGLKDKIEAYCAENDRTEYDLQKSQDFSVARTVDLMSDFNLANILTVPHQSSQATLVPATPSSRSSGTRAHDNREDEEPYKGDHAGMGKRMMTLVKMGCLVNVDAPIAMMAIGGLLAHLMGKQRLLQSEELQLPIEKLESMALERHMVINRDALQSLAIIDEPEGGYKEDYKQQKAQKLTLFGLFNKCSTAAGRRLLRLWFLRPLLDIEEIKKRHDAVSVFSAADLRTKASPRSDYEDNPSLAEDVRKRIKGVKIVDEIIKRLRDRSGGLAEWKGITESVAAVLETRERLAAIYGADGLEVVQRFEAAVSQELNTILQYCVANIDWDMSRDENRMCVRPGVDKELDELKKEQKNIDLAQLATKLTQEVDRRFFSELKCTYWDHFGFLVRVKTRGDGYPAPEGFDLIVEQDGVYVFKTPETRQLDEHFGDIGGVIRIKEAEIMAIMADKVVQYEAEFKQIVEVVSELDCLLTLASAASAFNLIRPTMAPNPILNIHKGRNLLQEVCVTTFVANDTKLEGGPDGERYHSMMIVTGANASGKSAYGKQVALIAFMAQIGSFVPAQEATIGIVDKIFTRIQTRESVSKPASAFMIDLEQVSHALRGATERSLIILDEFGKGTEPADGAGLLAGVIEYLLNGPCPRTVVLTHFHELFTQQFISEDLQIQFCYMRAEFIEGSDDLTYLFKLKPGRCDSSFAAECALAHGMPAKIVDRGREVTHLLATHQLDKLWDTELTPDEIRELEKCETLAKRFLSWDIDPETTDVMDTLQSIYESVIGVEEEEDEAMNGAGGTQDQDQAVPGSSQPGERGSSRAPTHGINQGVDMQQGDQEPYYDSSDQDEVDDDRTARWTVQLYSS